MYRYMSVCVCAGVHADGEVERPLGEAHLQDVSRDPHLPREFLQNSK